MRNLFNGVVVALVTSSDNLPNLTNSKRSRICFKADRSVCEWCRTGANPGALDDFFPRAPRERLAFAIQTRVRLSGVERKLEFARNIWIRALFGDEVVSQGNHNRPKGTPGTRRRLPHRAESCALDIHPAGCVNHGGTWTLTAIHTKTSSKLRRPIASAIFQGGFSF